MATQRNTGKREEEEKQENQPQKVIMLDTPTSD